MDTFLEYMIKAKKTSSSIIRQILIMIATVLVLLVVTFIFLILPPEAITVWPLCMVGVIFFAYKMISSYDVEYEYILTNGELDVDKITHRKKRRRIITVHSKTFIEFAKAEKKDFTDKNKEFARVIDTSAHSSSYVDYYAVFFKNGQKIKLIFNPTAKMIEAFRIYAPRVVKDEE